MTHGQNRPRLSGMVLEVHMHRPKISNGLPLMRYGPGAHVGRLHEHSYVAEYVIVSYCRKRIESGARYERYGYESKYTCSFPKILLFDSFHRGSDLPPSDRPKLTSCPRATVHRRSNVR